MSFHSYMMYWALTIFNSNFIVLTMLFVYYPKCSTCKKAKKWLEENNLEFQEKDIVEDNPTVEELKEWYEKSDLPLKRFFNTSGMKYRELKLKDKLPDMSEDEQLELLSTDGMLVKRPVIVSDGVVLTGFRQKEWEEKFPDKKIRYVLSYQLADLYDEWLASKE